MKKKITRIAITGAMGRMGRVLIKEIQKNKNTILTTALVKKNHPLVGEDIGEKIGIGKIGVSIDNTLNIEKNNFDVLIDFTKPSSTLYFLEQCCKFKKNIIIGTTGFSNEENKNINAYSEKIALMISSNFSIGINLLCQLVQKTTKILGNTSDIDIIEFHHRNKIDIPSGTALTIGETISKVMNWELNKHSLYYKKGITKKIREIKKIGFSSIRSGNVIGKHSVLFSSSDEEIKITHSAFNRDSFAKGAIESAIWIHEKNQGLFNMNDILKDKF
ncbi:4-hydroxy-tetrahydrodipicolinate reductase [Buchnera aphidicola (Rhopalosiphum padi)]|jgi:4-hydroxy-tetrahydrodipicolinate reductase|uniref:4-hydroxy-tetrahydrodipicolinate reductase n=1 Tax=Buchnera aphidicola subsp. Rhopalosiphum padi TaxID=98793 RepID=A0A4D6Y5Z7_BUCRP|nr:4-hydroxy-tetrahydrodipicolinate reductase [Buchnera aphidicola]QCI24802.1 4-hydroxy-tetrahydrodipicolinate reductase [Buchnera aphidicola (Rhopalosiphum padi)]